MRLALEEFRSNMARCKSSLALYSLLKGNFGSAYDLDDILRYTLASVISAIDRYVHHVVEIGMMDCQSGKRPHTKSYLTFTVSMSAVHEALINTHRADWFLQQIRARHGLKPFQKSSTIHEVINLIQSVDIWALIARDLNQDVHLLRLDYDLYVERRHAIVHEADVDPTGTGSLTQISEPTVSSAVDLVEKIVESMHHHL